MRKKIKADSKPVESKVEPEKDLKAKPDDLPVDAKPTNSAKAKAVHSSGNVMLRIKYHICIAKEK